MTDSPSVQDIASRLRPVHAGLRADLEVTRHLFRGQPQYVVRDPLTFQTHQISQQDYQILVSLNDALSLGDIFEQLVRRGKLERSQERDFYQFILTLHRLNYLSLPIADGTNLYRRFAQRQRDNRWRQLASFLFLRIPLVNPDAFLHRTVHWARPLFTRTACAVWVVMMCAAGMILFQRWADFRSPFHTILANETLLFLWVALIGLKVFHEFGHAYACKVFGGTVPEMGAYLIVFTPCAYVDASAAWGFARLRQRVIVSLAGMYFESIIACLALLVWSWTDNPLLSSWAHRIVVLSSVVTIAFNINPLMRYDGYYVLSDLVGIPNLRQRSVEEVQAMCKRILLGIKDPSVHESLRVRWLLRMYGIASLVYKLTLVLAICTMIAMKFYFVGVALAACFMITIVVGTLRRAVAYLWRSEETRLVRRRAVVLSGAPAVLLLAAITMIPVPGRMIVPGVVATDDDRVVYAQAEGFLTVPHVTSGDQVHAQQVLCQLDNAQAACRVEEADADTEVARLEYACGSAQGPHVAAVTQLRLAHAEEKLAKVRLECGELAVVAPVAGTVTQIVNDRDAGRFVHQGEPLATIGAGSWVVRCLTTAEEISSVRPMVGQEVRLRIVADGVWDARGTIEEVAVKGSRKVFSPALTQLGGGDIAVVPGLGEARNTLFEIQVRIHDADALPLLHGARATVSFNPHPQTCAVYLYRRVHQFLNRLRVS